MASARLSLRLSLRRLHLWFGLALGGLFALVGVTGSALVYYLEIDAALHPEIAQPTDAPVAGWDSIVWQRALETGKARWPKPGGRWSFEVTGEGGAIPARYYGPDAVGHHPKREMVWFSADGASVLRAEPWGGYLMSWLYQLHMELLMGETGAQIVGWAGFAMLALMILGLWLWWPRGSWRKALAFKRNAVPIRRVRDLHKLAGVWSAGLLIVLVGSGVLLALPTVKTQLLTASIAAPDEVPSPQSTSSSGRQIPIAQALMAARARVPDTRLAFIDVPIGGSAPIRVRVQVSGDPHPRFPGSYVFVDQYSGEVLAVHDIRSGNAASATAKWFRPLHDGSIAGTPTRILAILLGLVPLGLFVTGVLHWRRRVGRRAASAHGRLRLQKLKPARTNTERPLKP
jgi:uncharacterized iron-regulated membrane protein